MFINRVEQNHIRSNPPGSKAKRQVQPGSPVSLGGGKSGVIVLHRHAAVGDVIAASSVAKLLTNMGHTVDMLAASGCTEALYGSPHIRTIGQTAAPGAIYVELDGAYENRPDKKVRSIPELMIEQAAHQLQSHGISGLDCVNYANDLVVSDSEKMSMYEVMNRYPRPWIVVSPTSHRPARTVGPAIFGRIAPDINGTMFWASTPNGPNGVIDLGTRTIRHLMAVLSLADLAVVTESAPLHLAAGLRKQTLCIRMSTDPIIRVSHQRDVLSWGRTDLECLPCGEYVCHISKDNPPCAAVDPDGLTEQINLMTGGLSDQSVSCVIPVYAPNRQRLQRCLDSVYQQVNQIVIALDGMAELPSGMNLRGAKVCRHKVRERKGYGKTCNRGALETWGRYILFLNDDCYVEADAVSKMVSHFQDERVAVAGCHQRYPDGTIYFGGAIRDAGGFGHRDHRQSTASITQPVESEFINFACAVVRRKAFYSVDAFDERFDCYSEDADLCLRLQRLGWKLVYDPTALAVHEESKTTGPMKMELLRKGSELFAKIWGQTLRENANRTNLIL